MESGQVVEARQVAIAELVARAMLAKATSAEMYRRFFVGNQESMTCKETP